MMAWLCQKARGCQTDEGPRPPVFFLLRCGHGAKIDKLQNRGHDGERRRRKIKIMIVRTGDAGHLSCHARKLVMASRVASTREEESQWISVEERRKRRVAFEEMAKKMLGYLEDSEVLKVGISE